MLSPIGPLQALKTIQANSPSQAEAPAPQAKGGSAITIELSPAAQARLLKSEGQSVPEIALKLRLDENTVGAYIDQLM